MKYFITTPITTESELKDQYRNLSKIYHPDKGGDDKVMAEINRQYQEELLNLQKPKEKEQTFFTNPTNTYFNEKTVDDIYQASKKFSEVYFQKNKKGKRERQIFETIVDFLYSTVKK